MNVFRILFILQLYFLKDLLVMLPNFILATISLLQISVVFYFDHTIHTIQSLEGYRAYIKLMKCAVNYYSSLGLDSKFPFTYNNNACGFLIRLFIVNTCNVYKRVVKLTKRSFFTAVLCNKILNQFEYFWCRCYIVFLLYCNNQNWL